MSENLRKTIADLEFVSRIKCKKTKTCLLKYFAKNPRYFMALKEITQNIIKGHVPVDNAKKKLLKKHKSKIICLSNCNKTDKNRRKLVVQSGGWLWIIPIVSALIELVK